MLFFLAWVVAKTLMLLSSRDATKGARWRCQGLVSQCPLSAKSRDAACISTLLPRQSIAFASRIDCAAATEPKIASAWSGFRVGAVREQRQATGVLSNVVQQAHAPEPRHLRHGRTREQ